MACGRALGYGMLATDQSEVDRVVFDTGMVRIGAFRCSPCHPSFHDSGPARNCCFVFPRTAVEIQHEHQPAFAANPNVVTFYNKGQTYLRNAISDDGDRCDWFGMRLDIVQDVVRAFDPTVDVHRHSPFRTTRGWSDANTYLAQRRLFDQVLRGAAEEPLAIEESVVRLLERVLRMAYGREPTARLPSIASRQDEVVRHAELILSERWNERLTLRDIATEVGMSAYHLCRLFHRKTGLGLHQYRQQLRVRWSLERVAEVKMPLVDVALEAGFSSHSHFTSTFRREFGQTPSSVRACRGAPTARGPGPQYSGSDIIPKSAR
jgi:AraC family transcriptional regulator